MSKEEIFSRLNIKDYNNKLEKIIEKKVFSEDTKNLLLSMLYKMEVAYEDYNKVKVDTKQKRDILEEILRIIELDCKYIELVKPTLNKNEILKDRKSLAVRKDRKVISYPNERALIYAIYGIRRNKYIINEEYSMIKKSMEDLLNIGVNIDSSEIIRDFDGWSWNVAIQDIEDLYVNLIYQNIYILLGNSFLNEWLLNGTQEDYIPKYKQKLVEKYGEDIGKNLYRVICQNSILLYIKKDKQEKDKLIKEQKELEEDLSRMENKKEYLQNLANKKKYIGKRIREIDSEVNDSNLLKEEFNKRNELLGKREKVFSLSDLSDLLVKEREELIGKLKEYTRLMDPMTYVNMKNILSDKVQIIKEIELEKDKKGETYKHIVLLQKEFLRAFEKLIKKSETKKELEELLYKFRYYKRIPVKKDILIKDMKEINEDIKKIERILITKACKLKMLTILSNNIDINFNLISNLLNTKIIDLDEVIVEFKKKEEKTILVIYEDNMIDSQIEHDYIEDLNVKYNKKIKLFM